MRDSTPCCLYTITSGSTIITQDRMPTSPLPPPYPLSSCRDGQTVLPSCSLRSCSSSCFLSSTDSLKPAFPLDSSSPSCGPLSSSSPSLNGTGTSLSPQLSYPTPLRFLHLQTPDPMASSLSMLTPLPCQQSPLCHRALTPFPLQCIDAPLPLASNLRNLDGWFWLSFLRSLLVNPQWTPFPVPLLPLVVGLSL